MAYVFERVAIKGWDRGGFGSLKWIAFGRVTAMVRNEALEKIYGTLEAKHRLMSKELSEKLGGYGGGEESIQSGDSAVAAFASDRDEIHSRVTQIEMGELLQVERALARIRTGTYGLCECCEGKIPIGRLNALLFTVLCNNCQRDLEEDDTPDFESPDSWSRLHESTRRFDDGLGVDINRLALELTS